MMNACRSLLISMALLAATAGTAAAVKGKPPPPPHKPALPKPPHLPRMPVPHIPHAMPRHLPPPRVSHHPRPIVIHRAVHHVRRSATPIVRLPVRRAAIRTVHRYPVRRLPFRFVRRARYYGFHHHGHYRYSYFFYPGRYRWRTNYNLGHGALQRRRPRVIGGIVQSVQGIPGNGTLLVKVFRPRSGRFRFARRSLAAGSAATSLRSFSFNNSTLFEVMATPLRGGTLADLHTGAHVLILPHALTANVAQKVRVAPSRR